MSRDDATLDKLRRVADYEARLRRTPVTRLLRRIGPTRAFARVYRWLGPAIDPWLMRRTDGRVASRFYGLPALLLTTTGRRSGQERTSPVLYVRDGDDFVVVGTNFGQQHHPAWTTNLLAHPEGSIEVGPERLSVTSELVAEDWERLWQHFVEVYPGYQIYLGRTGGRKPRMFRLHPTN